MSGLSIVSQNPFDDLPDELIHRLTKDFDGPTTRSRFDSTCRKFYSKSTHLYEAAGKLFVAFGTEGAMEEFFQKYKKRMGEFNISFLSDKHKKFFDYNIYPMLFELLEFPICPVSFRIRFNERLSRDIIEEYASQPVKNMNIENFTQCIFTVGLYSAPDQNMEVKLRQAIKSKHNAAEFEAVRMQFLKPTLALLTDTQKRMERELRLEKKTLEERMFVLRGPNHFDGAIDAAYKPYLRARNAFLALASNIWPIIDEYLVAFEYEYSMARHDYSVAFQLLKDLKSELANIAQFNESGEIVGGRLLDIERALEPDNLQQGASDWAFKMASFYAELNMDVGETWDSQNERYRILHSIIDA